MFAFIANKHLFTCMSHRSSEWYRERDGDLFDYSLLWVIIFSEFSLSRARHEGREGDREPRGENIRHEIFPSRDFFHDRNSLLNRWLLSWHAHPTRKNSWTDFFFRLLTWVSDGTHTSRFCVHSACVAGSLKLLLSTLKYLSSGSLRSLKSSDMFVNFFLYFFLFLSLHSQNCLLTFEF